MKLFFYIVASISLTTVENLTESIVFNEVEIISSDCPECTKKFNSCSEEITNEYAKVVKDAADKHKADTITYIEYKTICFEAGQKMDKADAVCLKEFNKCCLAETKAEMEKNKKEKEEQ